MNTKLHAVTDAEGRPIRFFMTAGQVSDYTGAAALLGSLPAAEWLIADRGYDADWFRDIYVKYGRIPMRRWAEPADIAGPALFFCSDDARYVTGQVLLVDGGASATF